MSTSSASNGQIKVQLDLPESISVVTCRLSEGISQQTHAALEIASTEDLDLAKHTNELRRRDPITVCVDHLHMGVGGDDSWSPSVHPEYLIPPGRFQYRILLRPLRGNDDDPAVLARMVAEEVI